MENLAVAMWRRSGARTTLAPASFASLVRLVNEARAGKRKKHPDLERLEGWTGGRV